MEPSNQDGLQHNGRSTAAGPFATGTGAADVLESMSAICYAVSTDRRGQSDQLLVPEGWMMDGDSGRPKRAGQLSEVLAHYL